jgi:GAF domain-containing protein
MNIPEQVSVDRNQAEGKLSILGQIQKWWNGPHKTWETINRVVAPANPLVTEIGARRRASLQAWISVILTILLILGVLSAGAVTSFSDPNTWVLGILAAVMLVVYVLSRTPYHAWGGWLMTGSVVLAGYGLILSGQSTLTVLSSFIPLAFVLGSILLQPLPMLFWVVVGVLTMFFIPARFGMDVGTNSGIFMTLGVLLLVAIVFRNSIERSRLAELTSANEALKQLQGGLEQRVAAATRNLTLAAEVSYRLTQEHDLDLLLKEGVNLIQDRFELYYTQVYILDRAGRQLVLQAGTGEVGGQLMNRRHSLPVDLASLNGTAVVDRRAVIVENTATSLIHRPNPILPDTRSEMVVPLLIGERVVGTLDMQSIHPGALNKENLPAFEALAGQLAIAIENAGLLAETETNRLAVEAQSRRLVHAGWQEFLNAVERGERIGYTYDLENMIPYTEPISDNGDGSALLKAIPVSNEPVGMLKFEGAKNWSEEDSTLVANVAHQLGQQVENLRLLAQADQYRTETENALRRLTRQGWETQLAAHPQAQVGFTFDQNMVSPLAPSERGDLQAGVTQILEVAGEKIGELSVGGTDQPSEEIKEMLSIIGGQLSARVENLRLLEETERSQFEVEKRARQLAAVAEVSTVSSGEMDVQKMLASVVHLTQRKFGLYHAHIFLYDERTQILSISACGWKEGDIHAGSHDMAMIPINQEQSLVARSARTRQAVIVNDVHNEPGWLPNPLLPDTQSELVVPLFSGDKLLGVLDVQSDHLNAFNQEDANIQTTLASQVSIAIQNARSFTQAQQQAERESMLNVIGQKIRSATTVEAVLQIAARELGRALGAPLTIAQLGMKDKK